MFERLLRGGATVVIGVLGLAVPIAHAQVSAQSNGIPDAQTINLHADYQRALPTAKAGQPSGVVYPLGHGPASAAAAANRCPSGTGIEPNCQLQYNGGKIQTNPQIYLLLWGPKWSTSAERGSATYLESFYQGLGMQPSDTWSATTSQYTGTNGLPVFGTSTQFMGTYNDTSTPPYGVTDSQLAAEADAFARDHGLTGNLNAQVIVATQEGTCPQGFYAPTCDNGHGYYCAWHTNTPNTGVTFTNLPYLLQAGYACGENFLNSTSRGKYDGLSMVGGHEYAETITDPVPDTGWIDRSDNVSGGEIGDKCAWGGTSWGSQDPFGNVTLPTGTFAMQSLWSNTAGKCVMKPTAPDQVSPINLATQTAKTGDAYSLAVHAKSSTGAPLGYRATGLPPGLSMNTTTGKISGTPLMVIATLVTVSAGDTTGAMQSATFQLTVVAGKDTVYVTNPGYQVDRANQSVSLQIAGYSSTGKKLTYHATALPPGLSISSTTGLISGRLKMLATTFVKQVTVTATDSAGKQYTTRFYWTVSPVIGQLRGYRNECASDYLYHNTPGTPAVIDPCNSTLRERWTLGPNYELISNGLCLTDPHNGRWGTKLTLTTCHGYATQQWYHQTNGQYVVAWHRLCLTDPHWSTTAGTQLILQSCRDWQNQRWTRP